jgi:hypothetical protein
LSAWWTRGERSPAGPVVVEDSVGDGADRPAAGAWASTRGDRRRPPTGGPVGPVDGPVGPVGGGEVIGPDGAGPAGLVVVVVGFLPVVAVAGTVDVVVAVVVVVGGADVVVVGAGLVVVVGLAVVVVVGATVVVVVGASVVVVVGASVVVVVGASVVVVVSSGGGVVVDDVSAGGHSTGGWPGAAGGGQASSAAAMTAAKGADGPAPVPMAPRRTAPIDRATDTRRWAADVDTGFSDPLVRQNARSTQSSHRALTTGCRRPLGSGFVARSGTSSLFRADSGRLSG